MTYGNAPRIPRALDSTQHRLRNDEARTDFLREASVSRSQGIQPWTVRWALVFFLLPAAPLGAQLVEVKNDSVVDFGNAVIQAGFVAGERAASWLTAPCNGDLVAVRLLWLDLVGSGSQTLGEAVRISESGIFPQPGTQLLELLGPVMTEGVFNEFVINPPIPVTAASTVIVDFQFLSNPPAIGPSLVTDADGCQASRNGVFAIPPSQWLDLCSLGVSGDLAIRAVVNCSSLIFEDGFESGDTSGWSDTVPSGVPLLSLGQVESFAFPVLRVNPETYFWHRWHEY